MATPPLASPSADGEALLEPAYAEWGALLERAPAYFAEWDTLVGGVDATVLREQARKAFLSAAGEYTEDLMIPGVEISAASTPIVVTGHQPEIFHPGVWAKMLLAERIARESGGRAVDIVVDTDAFESVGMTVPVLTPDLERRRVDLVAATEGGCYWCSDSPDPTTIDAFCTEGVVALGTLGQPDLMERFKAYCDALRSASGDPRSLAETLTTARRRFEGTNAADYLELASSALERIEPYLRFVAHIALDARGYASVHNDELARYRSENKLRSVAQPFPDLAIDGDTIELPFWAVGEGRSAIHARSARGGVELVSDDEVIAELPADPDGAVLALSEMDAAIAPKAITLTLFGRAFVADLFIHGVGGARYDRVTDAVAERYLGVALPPYAVASLTMHLPLGLPVVDGRELPQAKERLNRLSHNPDTFLGEAVLATPEGRDRAEALARRKAELVEAIAVDGADKKALGREIRDVNAELTSMLEPVRSTLEADVARLEEESAAHGILTDRTYPFFLWAPDDVREKAR